MRNLLLTALAFVCLAGTLSAQIPSYVPTNGLVAYYPFDGNANDASGNGNNGTVNGAILTTDRFATPNSAYSFNGGGNYINVPNNASLNFSNNISFTISAWVRLSGSQSGYSGIVTKMDNSGNGFQFVVGNNMVQNKLATEFGQGLTGLAFAGNQNINDGNWHNVLYVVDRTSNTLSYYIDNALDAQTTSANISLANIDNTVSLKIGVERILSFYFGGKLDDIGIWNRALTQTEITQLYTGVTVPSCSNLPSNLTNGLVGYWPFCGNANDESGNGNNGMVNGATLTNDRFGNINKAYSFNGVSDFISIGDPVNGLLDFLGGPFSISVWLKSGDADAPIITKQNPSVPNNNGDYNMDIVQGNARMATGFGSGTGAARHSNALINDNNWHHIVAVYTSTSIDVFVDGALSNGLNTNIGSHPSVLSNSSQPLLFGKGFNNYLLDGFLDDIGIWNRVLTQSEIAQLYTGDSVLQCASLPPNLTLGLVGYWPFCGNANDESGNGNNGVVNGVTLVADRFGNANKAYSFNGATQIGSDNTIVVVDNGIDIPNFSVNFSNNITISIWANVSNTNNGDFLDRRTDNNIDFVCSGGGNNINCHLGNIGPFAGNTNLSFNSWHHYVYVYNGSSIKLYVDGVLDSQSAASGFISNNTSTLRLGKYIYHGGLTHYFFYNGYLDDIGIWNRALTDPEITQLYTGDTVPPCASLPSNLTPGLVGFWPFCGNANDESGNGNNGTVNGATLTTDRFGNTNSAFDFNGVSSDITISSLNNLSYKPISYSVWILADSLETVLYPLGGGKIIIGRDQSGYYNQGALMIYHWPSNGINNELSYYVGQSLSVSNYTPLIGSWIHLALTISTNDTVKYYVNGNLISQEYFPVNSNSNIPFKFGSGTDVNSNQGRFFWNGKLDDIGIWNRVLSPEEIFEIYSDPTSCTTPYFSDLDNDGYGGLLLGNFCSAPPNGVLQGGDCDDANSSIHPGVNEICNGVDDDCDGIVDNGSVPSIGPILGNYQSCIPLAAGTRTFSVVPVSGVNNYAWSLPVGMNLVSGQGTPTINVSWASSTAHTGILGNLSVVPSMDCFTGNAVSVVADLNISVPVTPPSISGASRVCVGDVITYSISSVARARQYNWTLPTGMTLLSGQGSNVISAIVDSSFTGGLLNVSGINTCGGSPLRSKTISYNIPNTPAVIVGQTQGICDLSSVIFTTAGSFGSLGYNWIVPTGITILNGQGSNTIEVSVSNNFTNGILRVVATNNCGISNQRTINLSGMPGIPSLISGPINICPGSTGNAYSVQTATGATYYTWTVPASATITSGSSTKNILVDYSSTIFSNQSITVRAGNLCGESSVRNLTGISGNISFCIRVSNGNDKSELSIYPNPANQILYLSANGETPQNIEIYNLLGVRVKNQGSGNEVILKDLVEGVYVLKAIINQKVEVRRFEVVR